MITALLAAGGAAVSGISTWLQSEEERKKLEKQKKQAQDAYNYQRDYNNQMYSLQKNEARQTGMIQQNRLAQALGADVQGFNLGLEGQARQAQDAQIATAGQIGANLAAEGMSGTRGNNAAALVNAYAQRGLQENLALQERGNALQFENMGRQYSNQFNDIGRELASWDEGGFRAQSKSLQDTLASQMHGLQMEGYDDAIADATPSWMDYGASVLSGAASGASFAGGLNDFLSAGGMGQGMWDWMKSSTKNLLGEKNYNGLKSLLGR